MSELLDAEEYLTRHGKDVERLLEKPFYFKIEVRSRWVNKKSSSSY